MTSTKPSPLISSPAVGFEQPFELLDACHERVDRTLALLQRLLAHIDAHGHDEASRSAAVDVMRYFDLAAPHHHLDEERHVFPPVQASGDPALAEAVQRLLQDHEDLHQQWAELRVVLAEWARPDGAPGPVSEHMRQAVQTYCARYAQHKLQEDGQVYPAAQALMQDAEALLRMGAEMRARRQA